MSFAIGGLDDDDFYEDDIEFCAYPSRVKVWVVFSWIWSLWKLS